MDLDSGKEAHAKPLSERDKRILRLYGRVPCGGSLGQHAKDRFYFDSGDFALSAAHRGTDIGMIQTGTVHPVRESISHPYAPIPSTCNANNDANNVHHANTSPSTEIAKSPVDPDTEIGDEMISKGGSGRRMCETKP